MCALRGVVIGEGKRVRQTNGLSVCVQSWYRAMIRCKPAARLWYMISKSLLDRAKAFLCWDEFPDISIQLVALQRQKVSACPLFCTTPKEP